MIESPRMTSTGNPITDISVMRSYLYRISEQINVALDGIGRDVTVVQNTAKTQNDNAVSNIDDLKALIIKTGDIVTALDGYYQALDSEFGSFSETIAKSIEETNDNITENYKQVTVIDTAVNGLHDYVINTENFIRSGLLYYDTDGTAVVGIAIGENLATVTEVDEDGEETVLLKREKQYAVYTSDELAFYDGERKIASAGQDSFHMFNAEVDGYFKQGTWRTVTTIDTWTLKYEGD